jgi:hypothetical protein
MSAEQRFGPNTAAIERVLAQIESATPEQIDALAAGFGEAYSVAYSVAYDAAFTAARDAARGTAFPVAWGAVWTGALRAQEAALFAACDAVLALAVAHLVGQFGLTREHVETLMGPYSSVFTDPREVVAA